MCPVSMTYSAVPALRTDSALAAEWEPRLTLPDLDRGALCGMAMTEKQGGSDVRAGTTRARPDGAGGFELTGHKWFCSHPMCDVFLILAQAPGGLSCFVVERGAGFEIQRLKDKLGTRSLASAEIELRGARGRLLGEEGRGVATIIEMVTHTRLDCIVGSASGMRRGVAEAVHHARHRDAFGARLAEQPLMLNVLADLAVESEAATASALRLARAYDEDDRPLRRFATAVMKYWICKRATPHAAEALECLGGNGYVEESPLPQLLRDAPLNGIWEGSGNVISLDVLRALVREPEGPPAFLAECELARGGDRRLDAHLDSLPATLAELAGDDPQWLARRLVEELALALQGFAAGASRAGAGRRRVLRRPAGRRPRPGLRDAAARHRRRRDRRAGAGVLNLRPLPGPPLGFRAHDGARAARRRARGGCRGPRVRQPGGGARNAVLLRARLHPRRARVRSRRGGARRRRAGRGAAAGAGRARAAGRRRPRRDGARGDAHARRPDGGAGRRRHHRHQRQDDDDASRPAPARGRRAALRPARRSDRRDRRRAPGRGADDAGGDRPAGHVPRDAGCRRQRLRDGGVIARARAAARGRDPLRRRRVHEPEPGPSRLPSRHGELLRRQAAAVHASSTSAARSSRSTTSGAGGSPARSQVRSPSRSSGLPTGRRSSTAPASAAMPSPSARRPARCRSSCRCAGASTPPTR